MIAAVDLRRGMAILFNNEIHLVLEAKHYSPGNKRAFVQAQLRNIRTGKIIRNKFSSQEAVECAHLEPKAVQYMYRDASGYHFMDLQDYHTITVDEETVGEAKFYLKENLELEISFSEEKPIEMILPNQISLKVINSPPGIKGDSVTSNTKPATLETGLTIQVPLFVEEGNVVKVDTRTGKYLGRD